MEFYQQLVEYINTKTDLIHVTDVRYNEFTQNIKKYYSGTEDIFIFGLNTQFFRDDIRETYSVQFILEDEEIIENEINYNEMLMLLMDMVHMNKIIGTVTTGLPLAFDEFPDQNDSRIKRLENLRLAYFTDLMTRLPQGFSYDVLKFGYPSEHYPHNNLLYVAAKRSNNFDNQDVVKITFMYNQRLRYIVTLNGGRQIDYVIGNRIHMVYAVDELLRNLVLLQSNILTGVYAHFGSNDPTIKYYDEFAIAYLDALSGDFNEINDLDNTQLNRLIELVPEVGRIQLAGPLEGNLPRRLPYAGNNPQNKIIMEKIGCNANATENNQPVDPIDLEPIPDRLLVTVVPILYDPQYPDINNQSFCFNAHSLWLFWEEIANVNPPRAAINPINNLEFDAASIAYVKNIVDTIQN